MSRKGKALNFEERLARLQAIVAALEAGDRPLEESVTLYREGLAHAAACREKLAAARHEIEVCTQGELVPFEPDTDDGEPEEDRP